MFKWILTLIILCAFQGCGDFKASEKNALGSVIKVEELDLGHGEKFGKLVKKSSVKPIYGNRMYIYNVFSDIFGPTHKNLNAREIAWASYDFGSGFGLYNAIRMPNSQCDKNSSPYYTCKNVRQDMRTPSTIGVNAPREARRMSACYRGINSNQSFDYALSRIQRGSNRSQLPNPTMKNYQRVYKLFFRGADLPEDTFFDNFSIIMKEERQKSEAWKKIILGVCLSPHWQAL